jgi:hypothetical protein
LKLAPFCIGPRPLRVSAERFFDRKPDNDAWILFGGGSANLWVV